MPNIFDPVRLGDLDLPNRILMAPLTRSRAEPGHLPGALMVEYYRQRASAGLIIAEATMAMEGNSAFINEPGIYSDAHAAAWKNVTDAVHAAGGRIALQIWHGGRACHPLLNNGRQPVAPSAIAITGEQTHTPEGKVDYVVPHALAESEIPGIIEGFAQAARHALAAGFDAVEIHGANGYLLDEFLRNSANHRTDSYGGPIAQRARLLLEVVDAVSGVWGAGRVGVRLSPINSYNAMRDSDPIGLTRFVAAALSERKIAYLHMMRGDFAGLQEGDVMTPAREAFAGALIGNMGYTAAEANEALADGRLNAVAFGTPWIANPDLVQRLRTNAPLAMPDPAKFYSPGPEGYTDYPPLTP
ncbi:MAG: alkene reductase [Terrimicrobiaceae bacterium]|nr:alkene reductase [Terrimicrobiaceae bacterium]